MKATYSSQYRKKDTGDKIFTYKVTGTNDEIIHYTACQEANSNKVPGSWPMDGNSPLFYVNVTKLMQFGIAPKKQLDLIFNQEGTRVFEDTSRADLLEAEELAIDIRKNKANIMAEVQLGLRTMAIRQISAVAQFENKQATPAVQNAEPATLADEIIQHVGAGVGDEGLDGAEPAA